MGATGTLARGIRIPIIRQGDDLVDIVVNSLLDAAKSEGFTFNNRDVVGITEAVVARAQGNYATVGQIAGDIRQKCGGGTIGAIFPILSRNRFSLILQGIAEAAENLVLMLSYPSDEVGNPIIDIDTLDESRINPYTDSFTEDRWRELSDAISTRLRVSIMSNTTSSCNNIDVVFQRPEAYPEVYGQGNRLRYTPGSGPRGLRDAGASVVLGLDDILTAPFDGSGYNEQYGLLGSNKATEHSVKLFPRDCSAFVRQVAMHLREATSKEIEVMVYGDGAFKDPVGGIWELADPTVSPAYTDGLSGTPNELKLKYLADSRFADLRGRELEALKDEILRKNADRSAGMDASERLPGKSPTCWAACAIW